MQTILVTGSATEERHSFVAKLAHILRTNGCLVQVVDSVWSGMEGNKGKRSIKVDIKSFVRQQLLTETSYRRVYDGKYAVGKKILIIDGSIFDIPCSVQYDINYFKEALIENRVTSYETYTDKYNAIVYVGDTVDTSVEFTYFRDMFYTQASNYWDITRIQNTEVREYSIAERILCTALRSIDSTLLEVDVKLKEILTNKQIKIDSFITYKIYSSNEGTEKIIVGVPGVGGAYRNAFAYKVVKKHGKYTFGNCENLIAESIQRCLHVERFKSMASTALYLQDATIICVTFKYKQTSNNTYKLYIVEDKQGRIKKTYLYISNTVGKVNSDISFLKTANADVDTHIFAWHTQKEQKSKEVQLKEVNGIKIRIHRFYN